MEKEFELIASAEGVRKKIAEARARADEGRFDAAEECLREAEELKRRAHAMQTGLITSWEGEMTPLVAHAMDHVFSFDHEIETARQFTELKKTIAELKRQ